MRSRACLLALLAPLLVALPAPQAELPPVPTRWVTDTADILSEPVEQRLDARLQAHERATGQQLLVWTGRTTGDMPLEEWSVRTFEKWRVGRAGIDDGLVVFVLSEDRRIRIEVGYGLEPIVTDAEASRLVRQVALPALREGDADGAITGTVDGLLALLGGEAGPSPPEATRRPEPSGPSVGDWLVMAVVGVVLLILFITRPGLAVWLLVNILSGGRGGGYGGGGGGFRGGGGRSGGGGASGSW